MTEGQQRDSRGTRKEGDKVRKASTERKINIMREDKKEVNRMKNTTKNISIEHSKIKKTCAP